jgi:hypothetical protein
MHEVADSLIAAITRTQGRFGSISDQEAGAPLKAGGWSRKQVIGHLIDSACNNHQRFVLLMLNSGVTHPGYEQAGWVDSQRYQDRAWRELLQLWAAYNVHLAHIIRFVPSGVLHHQCRIAGADPVTLEFLMRDYVAHLEHHLGSL